MNSSYIRENIISSSTQIDIKILTHGFVILNQFVEYTTWFEISHQIDNGFKKEYTLLSIEAIIGKILKSLRIKRGLSQEELAFQSNLDRTYISMLERGIHQPTISTLISLSKPLNIKPSDFMKLIEQELVLDKTEEDT